LGERVLGERVVIVGFYYWLSWKCEDESVDDEEREVKLKRG
jgi:hypothetical protein